MYKTKRNYWFELDDDFFQSKIVKKLRKEENGDTLALIYLRLLLSTIKSEGIITFDGIEDSVEEELSLLLNEDQDNIARVIELIDLYDLAEKIDSKSFFLKDAQKYIFSESTAAKRMRKLREKKKKKEKNEEESLNGGYIDVTQ